ncbi:MAG: PDZ domain-containing protein [Planctomycetia bacterium]|nr:PDZ domain-containing protein [Planctomycetia bacterium]
MKPLLLSIGLALLIAPSARSNEPAVDGIALAARIRELDADDYFVREQASAALVEAGPVAIPLLVEAARAPELETSARAISVLGQLALSTDVATADAAEQALDGLAESGEPRIVGRAKTALRGRMEMRRDAALARLEELGATVPMQGADLISVQISGETWKGTDEDLQLLRWFPEMTALVCDGVTLGDEAFAFFGPRTQLRHLRLLNTKLTDAGFAHVKQLPNLLYLQAENVPLTDASMSVVSAHPRLELLNLRNNAITDAGLAHIVALKDLETLQLEGLAISDAGLKPLSELTGLKSLELKKLPVTGAGLAPLVALKSLETVRLDGLDIHDDGMQLFAGLNTLMGVELKHLPITSAGLKHVESLPRLRMLYVKYCPVDDTCLAKLGENPNLSMLSLYGTEVTMAAADAFIAAHSTVRVDHRQGGFLGVIGTESPLGCELQDVQPGMAAAEAGFHVDDLITHYNGAPVGNFEQLRAMIRTMKAGEKAEVRAQRNGEEFVKTVTLGEEN